MKHFMQNSSSNPKNKEQEFCFLSIGVMIFNINVLTYNYLKFPS
jgi:hypothetical protein